jgi:penicillin-binding protein 1A
MTAFIRFSNTTNGQGASAALPVWGYFYNEVEKDKTLPYSDTADFAKPAVDINESNYDYINNTQVDLGAQGSDLGSGQSSDYEQGFDNSHPENIAPESNTQNLYDDEQTPTGESKEPVNDKIKISLIKTVTNHQSILPRNPKQLCLKRTVVVNVDKFEIRRHVHRNYRNNRQG